MATRRYNNPINQDVSTRYASDLNDQEFALVRPHVAHGIIDSQSGETTEMGGEKGFDPYKQVLVASAIS